MSDGYRSFLALAIDILANWMLGSDRLGNEMAQSVEARKVLTDGVILIDEVDAHLHPSWQRDIGFRLQHVFPNMQFIVTSHSPFITQAASEGGLFALRLAEGGRTVVEQPVASVRGWRADQILSNPDLFGLDGTRDRETERWMVRHAELVGKRYWKKLTPSEQDELSMLERRLASRLTAPGESVAERELRVETDNYIVETMAQTKGQP